ncbi:MAG: ATP-dependent protease ATPase subunit HslU [Pirellulales bacterium]|nr:ATP-dependent protease ATPase subunit HslU [Pirellulales bacterium]
MQDLTPKEIVAELDRHIVGQGEAKRAVAIAVRNRWRRQQLAPEQRAEIAPKNILMIGPTGVGKTEIARRLAKLTGAPFIKVEATKYTEVGYYGRDVESMVRELLENAIALVTKQERQQIEKEASQRVEERLLDLLAPPPIQMQGRPFSPADGESDSSRRKGRRRRRRETQEGDEPTEIDFQQVMNLFTEAETEPEEATPTEEEEAAIKRHERTREKMRKKLALGELEKQKVEIAVEQKMPPMMIGSISVEQTDMDLHGMLEKFLPKNTSRREMTVTDARKVLFEQECESLVNKEKVHAAAIDLAENLGMIFVDELDKIVASDSRGADVSRQGVQRDLLPIVEGTTVQTKYGPIKTDHVLFVAAGAFHKVKPSDLMPELQGRFPIRVELSDLTKGDFIRILTEPKNSLTWQYTALLGSENVTLDFTPDAIDALAEYAHRVNQTTQNIGARRLATIMERLLEELSFSAPEKSGDSITIDAAYVTERLEKISQNEDLSRFIL